MEEKLRELLLIFLSSRIAAFDKCISGEGIVSAIISNTFSNSSGCTPKALKKENAPF